MKLKKLNDVCDFINGLWTGKNPPFINVSVIRNTNFHKSGNLNFENIAELDVEVKQFKTRQLKYGDIILEKSGGGPKQPVGRVCVFEKDDGLYSLSNFTSAIRIKNSKELDYKYLHYFLLNLYVTGKTEKIQTNSTGIRNLQLSLYKEFLVPVLSLATQQKIVAKLEAIFAEIDTATAAAEASANNAKALFQSYLTEVFERGGEGWETKKLPELCTLFNGRAYKKEELLDIGKYTVLRVGNFFTNEHWYYSDLELEENKYCDNGDLLYAWSASFGPRIWDGDKVIYHYHIWKVKPNLEVIDKNFLYFLLEWDVDKIKKDHGTGTTMIHVSKTNMETRILPYINLERQKVIVKRLQNLKINIDLLILGYKDKKIQIELLKQSILQRAFSGELVKD